MTPTRRPSLALLISVLALVVALAGATTAGYAAGKAKGDKLIKEASLSGNRLKPGTVTGDRLKTNTVTGSQVDESSLGTVPSAQRATVADGLAPAPLTALAPLVPFTSVGRQLGFRKDASGFVHLQGEVSLGGISNNVVFVLPAGARPGVRISLIVPTGAENSLAAGRVRIEAGGEVKVVEGSLANISLEGVTFFADQ